MPTQALTTKNLQPQVKLAQRIFEVLICVGCFVLLFTLGIRNVMNSAIQNSQSASLGMNVVVTPTLTPLPTQTPETVVLGVNIFVTPTATPELSEVLNTLIIKTVDGSNVAIYQEPDPNSAIIGEANNGDTFEFLSLDSGWYEIKLNDELTGFISEAVTEIGEMSNL